MSSVNRQDSGTWFRVPDRFVSREEIAPEEDEREEAAHEGVHRQAAAVGHLEDGERVLRVCAGAVPVRPRSCRQGEGRGALPAGAELLLREDLPQNELGGAEQDGPRASASRALGKEGRIYGTQPSSVRDFFRPESLTELHLTSRLSNEKEAADASVHEGQASLFPEAQATPAKSLTLVITPLSFTAR